MCNFARSHLVSAAVVAVEIEGTETGVAAGVVKGTESTIVNSQRRKRQVAWTHSSELEVERLSEMPSFPAWEPLEAPYLEVWEGGRLEKKKTRNGELTATRTTCEAGPIPMMGTTITRTTIDEAGSIE
jgi:hypothetical protein